MVSYSRRVHLEQDMIELLHSDMSAAAIAEKSGWTKAKICWHRRRLGISKSRGAKKGEIRSERIEILCLNCNVAIKTLRSTQVYCSKKCQHACPVFRKMLSEVDKGYLQTEEYKASQRSVEMTPRQRYVYEVRKLTEKNYNLFKNEINPLNHSRTLAGVEGGYQLDHIYSIEQCFNDGWSIQDASAKNNLQMLTWQENLRKKYETDIS